MAWRLSQASARKGQKISGRNKLRPDTNTSEFQGLIDFIISIYRLLAQLFLDADQLVVLGHAVCTR